MATEVVLSDKEELFINALLESGGSVKAASEVTGYHLTYCYVLRKKLAKYIVEAAHQMLAMESVRASRILIEHMDKDMPNQAHLLAANSVLDRVGVIRKDYSAEENTKPVIKQNIFILPEKRFIEVIENERS